MNPTEPSRAEMLEAFRETGLARVGVEFDAAMKIEGVRIALAGAARARRLAARKNVAEIPATRKGLELRRAGGVRA